MARLLKITATLWAPTSNDCREVPPFLVDAATHNIPDNPDSDETLSNLVRAIIDPLDLGGLIGFSLELFSAELQTVARDPWGGYGPPTIRDEVAQHEDYIPAGYDEDGGQVYRTVRYFGLHAHNDAYNWDAYFDNREEAEEELSRALADSKRIESDDSRWNRRTPYGSAAWGPEDEWEMILAVRVMDIRNVRDFCEFVNRTTTRPRLLLGDIYAVGASRLPTPGNLEGRPSALDVAYTGWRVPTTKLNFYLAAWERIACAVEGRRCQACDIYVEVDAEAGRYGFACEFTQDRLRRLREACCCAYLRPDPELIMDIDLPF